MAMETFKNAWNDIKAGNIAGGIFGGVTDFIGLTDRAAPQRGLDALTAQANAANAQLDRDMQPIFGMYDTAMQGRQMGDVLDTFRQNMMGTENAASEENVRNFMNPMYNRVVQNAANQALAGAGSSLQSSAANQAVGTAVGNQVQNMWNAAFDQAMKDANNKQGIYSQVAQADLMPSQSWAQLTSDVAGTKYTKNMDLAQAAGQTAGTSKSWFGSLF